METLTFQSDREKWRFLESAPFSDALEPPVAAAARALRSAARSERVFAHLAHSLARDGIRYETDTSRTGGEHITTRVWEAYARGTDDCDAKARIFCALCLAGGLAARMVPRWRGDVLTHVSAEVRLRGEWVPVETTLARARLGDVAETVPYETGTERWAR